MEPAPLSAYAAPGTRVTRCAAPRTRPRPSRPARVGAFYHGRAGEAAQKKLGARGVTAWDVCEALRIE